MRFPFMRSIFARFYFVRSSLRMLFSRSAKRFQRRNVRDHQVFSRSFNGIRSAAAQVRLRGFHALESRAMLAADDIVVGLVNNAIVLTLDPAGAQITDLNTSYAANVLTITAKSAGTLSTLGPIPGVTIDQVADTISVDLTQVTGFAGVSVLGGAGPDTVMIGVSGVSLRTVSLGAADQAFIIDTGAGVTDTISVANPISSKGSGAVNLTTLGAGPGTGIQLAAGVTTPSGRQKYSGPVTLLKDTSLTAGRGIVFTSTVDGGSRLNLSAGQVVTLSGAVGGTTPLKGITLAAAQSVAVNDALTLDGSGTNPGTNGLTIAANVNNVVFSAGTGSNIRLISGFTGSGVAFLGGSTGSVITNLTSFGNGIGLRMGAGSYAGTQIIVNSFFANVTNGVSLTNVRQLELGRSGLGNRISSNGQSGLVISGPSTGTIVQGNEITANTGNGVTLSAAAGVTLGGPTTEPGNVITFNNRYGVAASGISTGSSVRNNSISNNLLGNVRNLVVRNGAGVVSNASGLTVRLNQVGLAAWKAEQVGLYAFGLTIDVNGVAMTSDGSLDFARNLVDSFVGIQRTASDPVQSTEFRQIGSQTYVNAQSLGATGLPWVKLDSATQGSQPAVAATNAIVTDLTPKHALRSLEFSGSTQFVGTDSFGQRYQTTMGRSTFVALLPLYDLAGVRLPPIDNTPTPVDVWVNPQGHASRFTATVDGVAITISMRDFGKSIQVVAPPAAQTGGIT
jgi:hypothetical protein